jgi:hypothetical protein
VAREFAIPFILLVFGFGGGAALCVYFASPDIHWAFRFTAGGMLGLVLIDKPMMMWFDRAPGRHDRSRRDADSDG